MKVLLVNGSPHEHGCCNEALTEIAGTLRDEGLEADIFWIGNKPIAGCIGCGACRGKGKCAFRGDAVNDFIERMGDYDGFIFASPVHYAAMSGAMTSFMDRVFYSAGSELRGKPAAGIVSARRGGTTAALDQMNKYFYITGMPIATSQYWPMVHGNSPQEVREDLEGLQIMRGLARCMAWMIKSFDAAAHAGIVLPEQEPRVWTNFVR